MDNSYKNELEFLDLSNLDNHDRDELTALLKSSAVAQELNLPWDCGENDYNGIVEQPPIQLEPKMWTHYGLEENMMKYETQANTSSSVLVSVPSTIQYGQQLIPAQMYHEWGPNMYMNNIPSDHNVQPYMQGMAAFPPHMYPPGNENQDLSSMRDAGRRGRGRGSKNFNRNVTHNEIQTNYLGDHNQYSLGHVQYQPYLCISDPNVAPQQHPAAGQPIYFPSAMYHSPTLAQQQTHHLDYMPQYHQSSSNTKYNHQSQSLLPQTNGESTKSTNHKSYDQPLENLYERKMQNVNISKPSIHQMLDDETSSSQTNIVTTVIVNNSNVDSSINDVEENLTAISNPNNKKFDVKIEQHIVSTRNDSYKSAEKNDIPCVNIKSSIEVKQNGNESKECDEAASQAKTPTSSTTSKLAVPTVEREIENEEVIEVSLNENLTVSDAVPLSTSPPVSSANKSWASILKKPSDPLIEGASKPTAFIAPSIITTSVDNNELSSVEKAQPSPRSFQNISDNTKSSDYSPLHTEIPQVHCDDPISYRMGEFLLGYQMDKQTVSLLPRGLTNRSNYCYINSILQALLACPPFYNLLMALPYSKSQSRRSSSPLIDNMIKFVREFVPLPEGARLARKDRAQKKNEDSVVDIQSGVPFEPSYIYTILKNSASGIFSVEGRQEDAEEFLSCLLNGISDEMLELMKLANNNDQKSVECVESSVNYNQDEEEWKVMGPKNKGSITRSTDFGRTPISDIFRGQLRSRVVRASEQATDYVQPFFTLQLDIEKAESVRTALDLLVGKDQLEGMTCSKTKQQIEAWKQVTLEELPVILILHLKWFDYNLDGCSKIVKSVEFPIDLKIDNKLMSNNARPKLGQKQRQYKLFAVTYHDGKEATKGHYVTDAFHVGYGGWVRYDDSSLKGVSEGNVLNPQPPRVPYLLYYRRCDTIGSNQSNSVKTR
ncbi:hypothetical protein QAD02_001590 [Eretmocerus hayati]|uniref:Uncharacterized protein n=1 Tax=Eretmocerus hayati TaxID=131215 RepID=A0ACC2NI79_9HYME|nr:hypothetical protein QAD02_001590 [Eretmocerus hayati]